MDGHEESRKNFLKKLGLSVGVTMLASARLSATILDNKENFVLTSEQQKFMHTYEKWMDEFIVVIRKQKTDPHDLENNKEIVRLSEIAKGWQTQLVEYMKDENFAKYYMITSEKMTMEI